MFEKAGPLLEAETGNADHRKVHRQHIALLAGRKIAGRAVHGRHRTIRKGGGMEAGCSPASFSNHRQIVLPWQPSWRVLSLSNSTPNGPAQFHRRLAMAL